MLFPSTARTPARLFRPDAAILDISIPGMSGYAAAQVTRSAFDGRRPLLIHLPKPYESQGLLRLLQPLQQSGA